MSSNRINGLERPDISSTNIIGWLHEDTLPPEYPYHAMFPYSRVDGVRLFPVFGPPAALESALFLIHNIASGSTTANSLPHIANIAAKALGDD